MNTGHLRHLNKVPTGCRTKIIKYKTYPVDTACLAFFALVLSLLFRVIWLYLHI